MLNFSELNEAQLKALRHEDGPALVLAGPGSGKTHLIVNRIRYLIEYAQVAPASILVITFTKTAALSMQKRFLDSMEGQVLPVNFGTFHSTFFQILKKYYHYTSDALLSNSEKMHYLKDVVKTTLSYERQKDMNLQELLHVMSTFKNDLNQDMKGIEFLDITKAEFERIFSRYQLQIKRDGRLDFDDMALACKRLFEENPFALKEYQNLYSYILIDEYQDINPIQDYLIKQIAAPYNQIFAVGDDDQAIYSFRKSSPKVMKLFMEDFVDAKYYLLNVNYRSNQEILDAATKVIRQNKERFDKDIVTEKGKGGKVTCLEYKSTQEEYKSLVDKVLLMKRIYNYEEMAIIARNNKELEAVLVELEDRQIPYQKKENTRSTYEHLVIQEVMSIMKYCVDAQRKEPAIWKKLNGTEVKKEKLQKLAPYTALHYLRKALGYEKEIAIRVGKNKEQLDEYIEKLDFMAKEARNFYKINDWLEAMDKYVKLQQRADKQETSGIHLLTIHGAKGLEFEYVCLIDINEGIIPGKQCKTKEEVEEECRMLYVGMTRAKKVLDILYSCGTKEYPRLPSRFLNPLLKK